MEGVQVWSCQALSSALLAVNPAEGQQRLKKAGLVDLCGWSYSCDLLTALLVLLDCSSYGLMVLGARVWEDVFGCEVPGRSFGPCCHCWTLLLCSQLWLCRAQRCRLDDAGSLGALWLGGLG